MDTNLSRSGIRKCELRFEIPEEELAVIDGYCSATGSDRTTVIRKILAGWTSNKLNEATVILRVVGNNPAASELARRNTSDI